MNNLPQNVRTIISISHEDKEWLDNFCRGRGISMTQVVRLALAQFRKRHQKKDALSILAQTYGAWGPVNAGAGDRAADLRKNRDPKSS